MFQHAAVMCVDLRPITKLRSNAIVYNRCVSSTVCSPNRNRDATSWIRRLALINVCSQLSRE